MGLGLRGGFEGMGGSDEAALKGGRNIFASLRKLQAQIKPKSQAQIKRQSQAQIKALDEIFDSDSRKIGNSTPAFQQVFESLDNS